MKSDEPNGDLPQPWLVEDIDLMIEALAFLEDENFECATWNDSEMREVDGLEVWSMPYPTYSKDVDRYFHLCYESTCAMNCYVVLPEDPEGTDPTPALINMFKTGRDFETASLNQVRRYLYLCTRGEKFCDGCIYGQIEGGQFLGAYRRLVELRKEIV